MSFKCRPMWSCFGLCQPKMAFYEKGRWTHSALAASTPSTSPMYSRFERRTWWDEKGFKSKQPFQKASPLTSGWRLSSLKDAIKYCSLSKKSLNSFNSAVYHLVYHIYLLYLVWASAQAAGESGEGRTAAGWTPSASATSPGRPPSPCWLPWSGWPPLTVWLPLPFACSLLPFSREGGVGRLEHSAVPVSLCSTKLCLDGVETTL